MTLPNDLQSLLDAERILESLKQQLYREPTSVFALVSHAHGYVSKQAATALRGGE